MKISVPLLLRLAAIATIFGILIIIPVILPAHVNVVHAGQSQLQRVSSRVYLGKDPLHQATGVRMLLPSQKYATRFDLSKMTVNVVRPSGEALQAVSPTQVGTSRSVKVSLMTRGKLKRNSDGSGIRVVALKSAGAQAIRVHFKDLNLRDGDELFVYGPGKNGYVAGPFKGQGPFGDGDLWVDSIQGDTVIIEHYFRGVERDVSIPEICHIFKDPASVTPQILSCELDATCSDKPEKDAVGRYDFISGGLAFVCTGTLVNDQANDDAPYFLTANHCISSEDEARSVEVFWFYQTSTCNGSEIRSDFFRSSPTGADLLANDANSDETLLSIRGAIPSGVVFAGWDPNPQTAGTAVFGLHHPGGDLPPSTLSYLRIANGHILDATADCQDSRLKNGYTVSWDTGIEEPGGSGSGLFATENGKNFLVGTLSCGPSNPTCTIPGNNLFGKFSDFYPKIQNILKSGPGCTFVLSGDSQSFGSGGGTGGFDVVASQGCAWSAAVSDSWIAVTSGVSGSGNGSVAFAVAANPGTTPRTGTITISGQVFTITEGVAVAAHNAELAVDKATIDDAIGAGGTVWGVNRLTPDAYPATLTSVDVEFSFAAFTGLTVGTPYSVVIGVNPSGSSDITGITLRTVFATVTSMSSFNVVSVPATTINGGDFVVGIMMPGTFFPLSVDQTSPDQGRSYISLDGHRFVLLRDVEADFAGNLLIRALVNEGSGNCAATITPTQQQFVSSGGMQSVTVDSKSGCSWTAATDAAWINVNPASGSGEGMVTLTVQPNTAGGARAAAVTIGNQIFLVTQAPGDTKPSITILSADLSGDTLHLTGGAADPGGDISMAQLTLLDSNSAVVHTFDPVAVNFGSAPMENFSTNFTGISAYPAALTARLVLSDRAGFSSSPVDADFSHGDPGAPSVTGASFNSAGTLILKGSGFGGTGTLQIEVNGEIVAPPAKVKVKGGVKLKIAGGASALNIKSGPNRVRAILNGLRSNLFVLVN